MSDWSDGFVAVDWGTTNRRAYSVDPAGSVRDLTEDDRGVLSVAEGGFPSEIELLRQRSGGKPVLLAGMVGSNRGWAEAPYVPCPAGLDDLASRLRWMDDRTAIVPGVSLVHADRADVMRGEEVQVFGAIAQGLAPHDGTICHPGTHTKWIEVEGGVITSFRTAMTGELFSLLRKHSILSELLDRPAPPDAAFVAGVKRGWAAPALAAELFGVRAAVLLGQLEAAEAASFASGVLIGSDLKGGLTEAGSEVVVLGSPNLTRLYAVALEACGRPAREVDGAAAFVAGMHALAGKLQ